jgi:multiple antibiotic resistance protein
MVRGGSVRASLVASMIVNLFLIVDPIGLMPLLAAITRENTRPERRRMVRRAILVAFLVLAFFAVVGKRVLEYFDVSIAAVRIAGGILLFVIGLEMLYGRISRTETTDVEEAEAERKDDVSVTPLAIPLLAGPGSIAAVVLFSGSTPGALGTLLVVGALAVVMLSAWLLLSLTEELLALLGQIGVKVIARVMGLLLLFVATQFVVDGIRATALFASP